MDIWGVEMADKNRAQMIEEIRVVINNDVIVEHLLYENIEYIYKLTIEPIHDAHEVIDKILKNKYAEDE